MASSRRCSPLDVSNYRRGFTLLDIVVALTTLAILATLTFPTFHQVTSNAQMQVTEEAARAITHNGVSLGAIDSQSASAVTASGSTYDEVAASDNLYLTDHNGNLIRRIGLT